MIVSRDAQESQNDVVSNGTDQEIILAAPTPPSSIPCSSHSNDESMDCTDDFVDVEAISVCGSALNRAESKSGNIALELMED